MPEWIGVVLVLLVFFFIIPSVWSWLEKRGGKSATVAEAADGAADFFSTAVVKLVGAGALLLGLLALMMLFVSGFSWMLLLAGPFLIAYGIYLVTPGERSILVFF